MRARDFRWPVFAVLLAQGQPRPGGAKELVSKRAGKMRDEFAYILLYEY